MARRMNSIVQRANEFLELPFRLALGGLGIQPQNYRPPHRLQFARDRNGVVIAPFPHRRARTSLPYDASLETSSHCFSVSVTPAFPCGENYILYSPNLPRTSSFRKRRYFSNLDGWQPCGSVATRPLINPGDRGTLHISATSLGVISTS